MKKKNEAQRLKNRLLAGHGVREAAVFLGIQQEWQHHLAAVNGLIEKGQDDSASFLIVAFSRRVINHLQSIIDEKAK
jgi:mitochondrial fission protein ELM1